MNTIPLSLLEHQDSVGGKARINVNVVRAWLFAFFEIGNGTKPHQCLLNTAATLCVIPDWILEAYDIELEQEFFRSNDPDDHFIIGRIRMAFHQDAGMATDSYLIDAKVATVPANWPILIGANFLNLHNARIEIDYGKRAGSLEIEPPLE